MLKWILGGALLSGVIGMGRCVYVVCATDLARAST